MRIALAHDSFTQLGGAERVLEALHELFPDAPVFTLAFDPQFRQRYRSWNIQTSGLQPLFLAWPHLGHWLPLIPWAVDSLNFGLYDVVISSSSGFIKNIAVPEGCRHIDYCHTPMRFLWTEPDYVRQEVPLPLRPFARLLLQRLKDWDLRGARRVTEFIANSREVQSRISRYYGRDSVVVYPFVDTDFWHPSRSKKDYFLLAGRLQAHKNNEIIIRVFSELGLPLRVAGTGRQEKYLRGIAGPNISFLGRISDEQLRDEYSGALAYLYPQLEDFGLMPLEAAACGTPTLAYGRGGALETIAAGVTGEFFRSYD
ncbi:MAG TPA: glycosyltransferase, partial [Patescibacteria group bacterium]|nr:glycosyltransferase [Patescibacteria group bacterium]